MWTYQCNSFALKCVCVCVCVFYPRTHVCADHDTHILLKNTSLVYVTNHESDFLLFLIIRCTIGTCCLMIWKYCVHLIGQRSMRGKNIPINIGRQAEISTISSLIWQEYHTRTHAPGGELWWKSTQKCDLSHSFAVCLQLYIVTSSIV